MANYGYSYLQPTPPKRLRRQVAATVRAQIAPYLNQINRRELGGDAMIATYSDQLAHQLLGAQAQTRATYGEAESQQAAVNAALAQRLSGAGASLASNLSGQLAAAGQSTAPSSAVGAIGSGAANAGYASDSASLSQLLAQGAAAQQYAGQLPNLARMQGVQQAGTFRAQQEQQRSDLLAKVPGLIDQATQQAQAQEFQKAVAVQSGLVDQQKLRLDTAYKSAKLGQGQQALTLRAAKQRTDDYFKQAGLDIKSKQYQLAVQREHRLSQGKAGKKGGFTPAQIQKMRSNSIEAVKALKHGQPNPNYDPASEDHHNGIADKQRWKQKPGTIDGRKVGAMEVFRYLLNHKIPPSMADWVVGRVYGPYRPRRGPGATGPR